MTRYSLNITNPKNVLYRYYAPLVIFLLCNLALSIIFYEAQLNLESKGYFSTYNVFFDSDPVLFLSNLKSLSFNIVHPLLNIFYIPTVIISKITHLTFNKSVFLLFTLIIYLKNTLTYMVLKNLNFAPVECLFMSLIFATFGSNIIFGFIPDHFQISSLLLILLTYFLTHDRPKTLLIQLTGILICGVTITNIIIYFLCCSSVNIYQNQKQRIRKDLMNSLLCLLATLLTFLLLNSTANMNHQTKNASTLYIINQMVKQKSDWIKQYKPETTFVESTNNNLKSVLNSIVLFGVSSGKIKSQCRDLIKKKLPCYSFNLIKQNKLINTIFLIACLTLLGFLMFLAKKNNMLIFILSAPPFLYNLLFHNLWGREPYLYSQHHIIFLFLLIGAILKGRLNYQCIILVILSLTNYAFVHINLI